LTDRPLIGGAQYQNGNSRISRLILDRELQ
jgi:hypothetical protein